MTDAASLYELQKIDSNWEKVRRRLIQIQKLTAEPEDLRTAREHLRQTDKQLHDWHALQLNAELESRGLAERIAESDKLLMSGTVRNPKELEQLDASVAALRRHQASVEEQGVNALLQVETLTKQQKGEQAVLAGVEKTWNTRREELVQEENKLKRYALQLKAQRAKLTESIPASDVALYDDLRKRKAGIAVSPIANGVCTACSVRVPTGVASTLRSRSEAIYCTSCGRILVILT